MSAPKVQRPGASIVTEEPFTTVMLRRLPEEMSVADLVELLGSLTPGKFDFVYVPYDRRKNTHIGLGFVNYVDADSARRTCEYVVRENKRRRWTMIAYNSNVQSLTYNLAYYVTRFGMKTIHDVYAPLLFKDGVRIESFYEISKVYEELPAEILKEASLFVQAERTGSARRGATVRRAQDLEWKPSVILPSAKWPQSCTEKYETEQSCISISDSTRSPSGCSDDNRPSPCQSAEMQEGVLLRLLQQYGSVTLSL